MKKENHDLIELFEQALLSRGLSPAAASRHQDALVFFVEAYLEPSEGMELKEVDAETVEYFLSNWYPRRVRGSRTELEEFIPTFRKFFGFLLDQGELSHRALEEILGVLSRKDDFLKKIPPRFPSEPGALGAPPVLKNGNHSDEGGDRFRLDPSLSLLVQNLEKPEARIILDFQLFLDYLAHHRLRLAPSTLSLPSKDLHRINQMFTEPEKLPRQLSQDQSRRLNLFYHLARNLDLFLIGPSWELLITPRTELFLELTPDQQLVALMDALWNRTRWSELLRFGADSFAGWAQEQRGGFAELLSRLPANLDEPVSGPGAKDRPTRMLASYLSLYEAVETLIMFGLREMAVLEFELEPNGDPVLARNHRGIKTIRLTGFGKKVMKYMARRAREERAWNPCSSCWRKD